MKRIASLALTIAFLAALCLPAGTARATTDFSMIKVKLTTNNATVISMSVKGEYFLNENGASFQGGTLTLRSNLDGTLTVTHSGEGELYTGETVSIYRVEMDPSAGYMYFNSRSYLGHFNVRVLSSGYLQVVNVVPLAHYLYGVVGHEMSNTFPIEALKAQAIAAKCYVLSCMKTGNSEYYIGDTSSDQVYKGYTASNHNVINAVDSTLSEVLTVDGSLLCTYYAASNGGETNLVTYAWGTTRGTDAGYAITLDEYDLANSMSPIETVRIPVNMQGSISRALFDMLIAKSAAVIGATPTGVQRITAVDVYGPRYQNVTRNMTRVKMTLSVIADNYVYEDIELDFSTADLYSYGVVTNATLRTYWGEYDAASGYYVIYHARWGHGVGMSQRGAQQRAAQGWNYKDILKFYYPGASFGTIEVTPPENPVKPEIPSDPATGPDGLPLIGYGTLTGNVNFRKGPGTEYENWGALIAGLEIPIYAQEGNWYRTVVNGDDGYVSTSYVAYTPIAEQPTPNPSAWVELTPTPSATPATEATPSPTPTPSPTAGITEIVAIGTGYISAQGVNFRTGPATTYSSMKKLARNTEVTAYMLQDGWYYVSAEGIYGYVSAQYVTLTELAPTPTPTESPAPDGSVEPPPEETFDAEIATITRDAVNYRAEASSASARLRQFEKNTSVYVLGKIGSWYYTVADGQFGYVYQDYVNLSGGKITLGSDGKPLTAEPERPSTGKGTLTGNVNFREGPGTSYTSYGALRKGLEVELHALENGWYKATVGTRTGYISSKYVEVTTPIPESGGTESGDTAGGEAGGTETPGQTVPSILGLGQTTGKVNFREGASTSSKKIGQIKKGETVMLYSLVDGWYAVDYNGTRGYLFAKYVKVIAESSGNTGGDGGVTPEGGSAAGGGSGTAAGQGVALATGSATGKVNFRNRPSTSGSIVLATLKQGEKLQILGETADWYYAIYNGSAGFAYKAYVKVESSGSAGIAQVADSVVPIATTTTAELNLREGMSTTSGVIKLMPNRSAVTVYMIFDGWCFLSHNGTFGFAVTDYVKLN